MIETEQLTRCYGNLTAVDALSIRVEPGQVLGLLGPNGAGKTTAMRMIAGFLVPTSGRAWVCGHDVMREPLQAKRALGYLPEGAPGYGEMTVHEFLQFIMRMRGLKGEGGYRRFDAVVQQLQLDEVLGLGIDTLSKGLRRRVGLAQAILHDPPVLMLDEPTDGLDPNQKHAVRQLIDVMARDRTILISTHLLEEVHALCNRVVIIARGKLLADATPAELEARSRYHGAVSFSAPGRRHVAGDAGAPAAGGGDRDRSAGRAHHRVPEVRGAHPRTGREVVARAGSGSVRDPARARPAGRGVPTDHQRWRGCARGARMSPINAVLRRELRSYFVTPVAYVFLVIFLVLAGILTFYVGDFYERGLADLQPFFVMQPWLYLILVPAITMRMWAEEAKGGTLELLLTLPLTLWQAMLGKFLAAWLFIGLALALTFPIWITVNYLGAPDNGVILAGYLGSWLMAGNFIAIGACLSALTRSQVVAFILTALVCVLLILVGQPQVLDFFQGALPRRLINAVAHLSMLRHFEAISRGVLDLRDLLYFLLSALSWLVAGVLLLDLKRTR